MSDYGSSDQAYYKDYYARMGSAAYKGESQKLSSRMQVFCDWLRAELKPGAKVLDVGCGDAIFAELMPEFEWYGVDINTDAVNGRIPNERLRRCDLMKPPYDFEAGTFDAVICSEVLEHLWDLRVVHKEVKRLLKRDGWYFLSTPCFTWITNVLEGHQRIMQTPEAHWTFEHTRHYSYATHKRFLNDCGFMIEKHTGADGHYCPITHGICREIHYGLREQGIEVPEYLLHKFAGRSIIKQADGNDINYHHTVIIGSKKA